MLWKTPGQLDNNCHAPARPALMIDPGSAQAPPSRFLTPLSQLASPLPGLTPKWPPSQLCPNLPHQARLCCPEAVHCPQPSPQHCPGALDSCCSGFMVLHSATTDCSHEAISSYTVTGNRS